MPKISAFEERAAAYDTWFDANPALHQVELDAIRGLIPAGGNGLEIGAGTGRFAAPLGLAIGVEPSFAMATLAKARGIEILGGMAEALPIADRTFDFALMMTVVCFLDDPIAAFREAHRILKPQGALILGFIDKDSELGRRYSQRKDLSSFYRQATFYSVADLESRLLAAGFTDFAFRQALFPSATGVQQVEEGHGTGSLVVVRAVKP
jgi:SAM-dependent methyltransferase